MTETLLIWGGVLLAAAILLLAIELFVPSGGVIGAAAFICAAAGVVMFFRVSIAWGSLGVAIVLVAFPSAFFAWVKFFPYTSIGQKMLGDEPEHVVRERAEREIAQREALDALVGLEGEALTDLYPSGYAQIDGERRDVLADGAMVEAGEAIVVNRIVDGQIHVRAAT